MSDIRRSHRAKKPINYNKLADINDEEDADDFVDDDFDLPVAKKARKEHVNRIENAFREDDAASTKKRDRSILPGDQLFQQEILLAQHISLQPASHSSTIITTTAQVEDVRAAESHAARLAKTQCVDEVMKDWQASRHTEKPAGMQVAEKRCLPQKNTDNSDDYEEDSEEENDMDDDTDDDDDDDDYEDDKKTKAKSKPKTATKPKTAAKTNSAAKTNTSATSKKAATPPGGRSQVKVATSWPTVVVASNPVKRTSLVLQQQQQTAQKVVWSPPGLSRCGKSVTSGIAVKSPSSGLRLGLSRKANVKSLHSAVRVPQ